METGRMQWIGNHYSCPTCPKGVNVSGDITVLTHTAWWSTALAQVIGVLYSRGGKIKTCKEPPLGEIGWSKKNYYFRCLMQWHDGDVRKGQECLLWQESWIRFPWNQPRWDYDRMEPGPSTSVLCAQKGFMCPHLCGHISRFNTQIGWMEIITPSPRKNTGHVPYSLNAGTFLQWRLQATFSSRWEGVYVPPLASTTT